MTGLLNALQWWRESWQKQSRFFGDLTFLCHNLSRSHCPCWTSRAQGQSLSPQCSLCPPNLLCEVCFSCVSSSSGLSLACLQCVTIFPQTVKLKKNPTHLSFNIIRGWRLIITGVTRALLILSTGLHPHTRDPSAHATRAANDNRINKSSAESSHSLLFSACSAIVWKKPTLSSKGEKKGLVNSHSEKGS